ncbi:MAG: hypothetical protein LBL04_13560 [Bacteroidales bacterium]|jgi:hypothetical protein|nr:hypothetical protein [Bacteroidales bacterium]
MKTKLLIKVASAALVLFLAGCDKEEEQVAITPELAVTPAVPEQVSAEGGPLAFTITANATWTYSLSAGAGAWLTEATKTAAALTLTVAANGTAEAKNATVTFSLTDYPDVTQEVAISQAANIIAGMNEADFGAGVTPAVLTATAADLKSTLEGLSAGNYVVNIAGDVRLSDAFDDNSNIQLSTPGVVISLRGNGSNTLTTEYDATFLRITEGKLILRDITLSKTGIGMPAVWIDANGTLEINDSVSITGTGESTNAGVNVNGGHFLMKGGEIHGYHRPGGSGGGGVYIHANGTFRMDGGKIYDNTTGYGGGVLIMGGSFTMNGGEFYDNHSTDANEGGGAVYLWAGNNHFEIHTGAVIYGKDGGDDKAGNTATNDTYGHAVSVFISGGAHGKFRSNTIQNETLSISTNAAGNEITDATGTWDSW